MKNKSKFRRAILRSEIEKKYSNHGVPGAYKGYPSEKALKTELITIEK